MIGSLKEISPRAVRAQPPEGAGPALELDSDFGSLDGPALDLLERRYGERGLATRRESFSSRSEDRDVTCSVRDGDRLLGTLGVRFDGPGGLHADLLFGQELADWRESGVRLCEFGRLAVDRHAHDARRLLAQLFHLGYLHAYRRARCDRLVIEVNPRHVAFYRRWLGLLPYTTARHNPRVNAPAVLMSIDLVTVRDQIALWGGRPDELAAARCLYPLAWDEATEASMLAKLP